MVKPQPRARKGRTLQGRYTNYFEVGHNAYEFILDFGQFHPEIAAAQFHTRIVTGPIYAKILSTILGKSLDQYEKENGVIVSPELEEIDPLEFVKNSISGFDSYGAGIKDHPEE
jgi:hypothetical protein